MRISMYETVPVVVNLNYNVEITDEEIKQMYDFYCAFHFLPDGFDFNEFSHILKDETRLKTVLCDPKGYIEELTKDAFINWMWNVGDRGSEDNYYYDEILERTIFIDNEEVSIETF